MLIRGRSRAVALAVLVAAMAATVFAQTNGASASDYFLRFPWESGKQAEIINGYGSPPSHVGHDYYALDFKIDGGSTQAVVAAATYGVVVARANNLYCDRNLGYGNYVMVESTDPQGGTRYALYAHLSSVSVSVGDTVFQGQQIAKQGNTGWVDPCSAYHLHFRWTSAQYCSPETWCAKKPEPMSGQTGFAAGQTWTSWPPLAFIEGVLVKGSGSTVYVADNSKKRPIGSAGVFNACGYDWDHIVEVEDSTLSLISTGSPVGPICPYTLVQQQNDTTIYVIEKSYKRALASIDAFIACGYDGDDIVHFGPTALNGVSNGTPIHAPPCPYSRNPWYNEAILEGTLVTGDGPGTTVYVVDNGMKRTIGSAGVFNACGYDWNDVVEVAQDAVDMISLGPSVGAICPYTLVQQENDTAIYVIEKSYKRALASINAFNACGYHRDQIVTVDQSGLDDVYNGLTISGPTCPYTRQ